MSKISESFSSILKGYAYEIPAGISDKVTKIMEDSAHILNGARNKNADEDIARYEDLIQENPTNPYPYLLLASTLEAIDENDKALEYYELSSRFVQDPIEKGYILERQGACARKVEGANDILIQAKAMHTYLTPQQ